jgi:hypothetical protein
VSNFSLTSSKREDLVCVTIYKKGTLEVKRRLRWFSFTGIGVKASGVLA